MDFLSLSVRMAQASQGAIFPPCVFLDCSDEDFAAISEAFRPYLPQKVDSLYNNWEVIFLSFGAGYMVRRGSDDTFFDDRQSLIAFIHTYYASRSPEPGSPMFEAAKAESRNQ